MDIQLALDRVTIEDALAIVKETEEYIDLIEVGTSLIKEYGIESVRKIKNAYPHKRVVADIKTIDNAEYEFNLCFDAGADIATVMGVSSIETIKKCLQITNKKQKIVMVDLLNTTENKRNQLFSLSNPNVIFCDHLSKDEQEILGKRNTFSHLDNVWSIRYAVAGGITTDSVDQLVDKKLEIAIIGSAITNSSKPEKTAKRFKELLKGL